MRVRLLAFLPVLSFVTAAYAADRPDVKGLFLLADYPAVAVQPGATANVSLKLQNLGLAPERYQLSVSGVPQGWTATLLGGGQPVAAAMPATDASVNLELRLDIPAGAAGSTQTLTVNAQGANSSIEPSDRGDARQGTARQAQGRYRAAGAARHLEVELRISAHDQERRRPQSDRQLRRQRAEEFRDLVHRSLRQPGTVVGRDRGRQVQGRETQGPSADRRSMPAVSRFRSPCRRKARPPRPRSRSTSSASRG